MYIHEAIKARTADKPFVTRREWGDAFGARAGVKLLPTHSPDGMVVESRATKDPQRGWQPTAGDLVADDWFVTD